jgi:hypothetical protein
VDEGDLRRLVDRQQIEEVLNRYCRGVDRCDEATLAACYHEDSVDDHGTFTGPGREFAHWAVRGAAKMWAASHHSVHNVVVDWIDDDTAHVESYVLAFNLRAPNVPGPSRRPEAGERTAAVGQSGGGPDSGEDGVVEVFAGRYVDRFERRDGTWRIAHRLALRDVDTLVERRRWAGKIHAGGRYPDDPAYRVDRRRPAAGEGA